MLVRSLCLLLVVSQLVMGVATAAPPVREPAAIVYLSSLEGVLEDFDYIATAGGRPQWSQKVRDFVAHLNNLEGVDRTQPVGVFAFLPLDFANGKKDPDFVGFLPVTDLEALKKTLQVSQALSLESTDKPNRYEFKASGKSYSVQIDQGYALIAERAELLDQPLPTPASLTSPLSGQYDLVLQLRKAGVPKLMWDFVMLGALTASDKELKNLRKSREPVDLLKVRGIEMGRSALVSVMGEARSVWVGLRVSRETRNAVVDLKFEFADSGHVSQELTHMAESPASLANSAGSDAPAAVHLHAAIPEVARKLTAELGRVVRENQDPTKSIPEPQQTSVNDLLNVVQQTVDAGEYEVLLQFAGKPQAGMTMVVGVRVADGKKLSEAMVKLLPEASHSDKVAAVTLDAGVARDVHFARIDGRVRDPDRGDKKVEMFYGGKPSLYVGTDASTLWMLIGDGDALDDFASLAVESSRTTDRTAGPAFAQAEMHLSGWLGLLSLAEDKKTRDFTAAARVAVKDPGRDALRLTIQPQSDGLQFSLTLDEAFLSLIGAAVCQD